MNSAPPEVDVREQTQAFYDALKAQPGQRAFMVRVDREPAEPTPLSQRVKLVVVPAFFHEEFPDSGADGRVIVDVAAACGVACEVAPTRSLGSVGGNAEIVAEALEAQTSEEVWVVSLSKGGAELRRALTLLSSSARERLAGWINVSGLVHGCHFVDELFTRLSQRMLLRAVAVAFGMKASDLAELRTDHPWWSEPLDRPPSMRIVNVVCVPQREHLKRSLVRRYDRLKKLGPNDGMVLLDKALILPGDVYPIWGGDHFLSPQKAHPVFQRMLRCLLPPRK